ncbi:MAG: hypothetical protein Kow00102_19800 [Spirochaetota bacterium]
MDMSKAIKCETCTLRARYDRNPHSLLGRFWRWHINFCPGWKMYMKSLSEEKKEELIQKYSLKSVDKKIK